MLEYSDVNNLTLYTSLFWGASAVLFSDLEDQFVTASNILDFIVSSLDFRYVACCVVWSSLSAGLL